LHLGEASPHFTINSKILHNSAKAICAKASPFSLSRVAKKGDAFHLNKKAAQILTEYISEKLNEVQLVP
jgi:hypothetical protein